MNLKRQKRERIKQEIHNQKQKGNVQKQLDLLMELHNIEDTTQG